MESVWYYVVNGAQTGPVTMAELKAAAAAKKFSPTDLVWQEGTPDWVPASTVAELFAVAPPVAPPVPPPAPPKPLPPTPPQPTYPVASPPPPPSSAPSAPEAAAQMSPSTSPADAPLSLDGPEPLPLEDEPSKPSTPRKTRRTRDDDEAPTPAGGTPEWMKLIPLFFKRVFNTDPSQASPVADEEAKLTRAGIMDPTARKFAVWRRAMLLIAAVPCALAALFSVIDVLSMAKEAKEVFSSFGMFLLILQSLSLTALPIAAVFGALNYHRPSASMMWVLCGGLVSFLVPLGVAFVPGSLLIDIPGAEKATQEQLEQAKERVGEGLGLVFFIILLPSVLSLLPAVSRACIRLKTLLPESLVPGWGIITSSPLCVLLVLVTFVFLYHLVGNVLLVVGLLLWVGAPLVYLTRLHLLTRPITSPADRAALNQIGLIAFGLIATGVMLLLVFSLTAKVGGKTILGFDENKSYVRPWSLKPHKLWIEYLGRSLFLTVLFTDLLLRIVLSVWREERAFAGTPDAASFDKTMTALSSTVLPRGSSTPPTA